MVAQRGRDFLLKIRLEEKDEFITVAGMRSKKISFNSHTVDVTDQDSVGRWRELLKGSGVQRAAVSGSGVFRDERSDAIIREHFFQCSIPFWKMDIPDFGSITGHFQITSLEYSGNHDGEMNFEMSLESTGPISFVGASG